MGNCVHVAGVVRFLSIAEELGYRTVFLGAAVPVDTLVDVIEREDPVLVGISYRLTPDVGLRLTEELAGKLRARGLAGRRFAFGGTPPVCEAVRRVGLFEACFDGMEEPEDVWRWLEGRPSSQPGSIQHADNLFERLDEKRPYPLLRHHFGLPSLEDTIEGIGRIAESGSVDVISVAPDQNAQESMFRPNEMDRALDGAGGVPVRSREDLQSLHAASQRGNYPLLRIYSGTRDLVAWAELARETINNAWAAIPLCWYSRLDGRSPRDLASAIAENQECMAWHGARGIPVEVNEAHHWSLRDAHDTIAVVMAYIAAYNARSAGVSRYVAQYMFNTPPGIDGTMDLAKVAAQIEMVESLHGPEFTSIRQVRAGLLHLSPRLLQAKGQLAASTLLSLAVTPHIIHVVGFCEGDHAAGPDDVIESCEIVKGTLRNAWRRMPNMLHAQAVQDRKRHLMAEAEVLLGAVRGLADDHEDPFATPRVLAEAIRIGVLDAPHLKGNECAAGRLTTRVVGGAVEAVDPDTSAPISEYERLAALGLHAVQRAWD